MCLVLSCSLLLKMPFPGPSSHPPAEVEAQVVTVAPVPNILEEPRPQSPSALVLVGPSLQWASLQPLPAFLAEIAHRPPVEPQLALPSSNFSTVFRLLARLPKARLCL